MNRPDCDGGLYPNTYYGSFRFRRNRSQTFGQFLETGEVAESLLVKNAFEEEGCKIWDVAPGLLFYKIQCCLGLSRTNQDIGGIEWINQ